MDSCRHEILTLMQAPASRLRCRHCHLTISEEELGDGCCPECLEVSKMRRRDFEKIAAAEGETARYYCQTCGLVVEC